AAAIRKTADAATESPAIIQTKEPAAITGQGKHVRTIKSVAERIILVVTKAAVVRIKPVMIRMKGNVAIAIQGLPAVSTVATAGCVRDAIAKAEHANRL
ncbi:MAG: hypothetical protein WHS88_00965, partial [Anaerohalosphaeraceae bacterium]